MSLLIDFSILAFLVVTAVTIARLRDLWAAIMFTGIYSFLSASWMLVLDAPDVAFTEAAVGAGISTVLMLGTLKLTGNRIPRLKRIRVLPLVLVLTTGLILGYGTLDMPHFADPQAPIHLHPSPSFVERSLHDMHGLPNIVTSILASYRGYDTLGETTVVLTAGIAVMLILRRDKTPSSDLVGKDSTFGASTK
ncbi:Na(+)/H(+) antiporter subunit A [Novipirellula aureliae]|uniref:Na(+)/H(+) antiporter subunit A n=1 Tax=Novipirellula aureliae TaxID=2527966 RepID=A0A5C6DMF1_9BACT|nr:DUF4040 domain-containing protein [Novipirellula aureliae]TWU37812.1 Na(+)/H(+) antiporter subunit A [Novipirellula aureliae]